MSQFFTYVWGEPNEPAWPLTFANKQARSHAKANLKHGDLVYTVCTKGEPTPKHLWGRVVGIYEVSDVEVNTEDYDLSMSTDDLDERGAHRFPFALHPINVWKITDTNSVFSELVGPLTRNHHLQAQSKVVELNADESEQLTKLKRVKVGHAEPATEFGKSRLLKAQSRLAPKHEGEIAGSFGDHETWYVYSLVLRDERDKRLAVKVGYSHEPKDRENAYNKPLASEVSGLYWSIDAKQPVSNEDIARQVEQAVLSDYSKHQLASNREILVNVEPRDILAKIGVRLRDMKSDDT